MGNINDKLSNWPRNNRNQVIFKDGQQAVFYAGLIYDKPDEVRDIKALRKAALVEFAERRKRKDVNLDLLMVIATKGMLYRECIDEVDRLKNHVYTLDQGGK